MSPLTYYLMHWDSLLQCDISMNRYLQHLGIYLDLCLHFLCYYFILLYVPKTFFYLQFVQHSVLHTVFVRLDWKLNKLKLFIVWLLSPSSWQMYWVLRTSWLIISCTDSSLGYPYSIWTYSKFNEWCHTARFHIAKWVWLNYITYIEFFM